MKYLFYGIAFLIANAVQFLWNFKFISWKTMFHKKTERENYEEWLGTNNNNYFSFKEGFKVMLGQAFNKKTDEVVKQYFAKGMGGATLLKREVIFNKEGLTMLPENNIVEYNRNTTIATFHFHEPHHEMALPEDFIEKAQGIIIGQSNCELIYTE